jgi:hypothetical protein
VRDLSFSNAHVLNSSRDGAHAGRCDLHRSSVTRVGAGRVLRPRIARRSNHVSSEWQKRPDGIGLAHRRVRPPSPRPGDASSALRGVAIRCYCR